MIDPITGIGFVEALTGINASMQGQTLADAYNQRITGQYPTDNGPTIGFADYTTNTPAISGDTSGSISTGSGNTPVDAWHDYVENTPTTTVSDTTGGVVSGSRVGTIIYSIMEENPGTAEAAVRAIVPVAVPLNAAITAMAQAVGVSIDAANLDAETRNTLTNSYMSVSGVIYDKAKGLVTAWKDELGRILFPKKAFDAIYESIRDLNIGEGDLYTSVFFPDGIRVTHGLQAGFGETAQADGSFSEVIYGLSSALFGCPYTSTTATSVVGRCIFASSDAANIRYTENRVKKIRVSTNPNKYELQYRDAEKSQGGNVYTYDGKSVRYYDAGQINANNSLNILVLSDITRPDGSAEQIAWTIVYGTPTGAGYPDGTSSSEANRYTPSTIPVAGNLATSYDPETGDLETEPLVPIHLTDDPYNSTGDVENPTDPTDEDNPGVVAPPIPIPIPDTRPSNPDVPLVDSSVIDSTRVDELVEELASTLDPQPPQSTGIIPVPQLPGIVDPETGDRTFPSIIPDSGPGFIHVYNPTPEEFVAFGSWLWVTYADATIDKILNNPFDGVIGAHELYATPNRGGRDNIRSAFLVCPTSADLVPNRYSEIDCGTVIVPEFYGNYLDYSPYSQAYIYLPFIGINEVSIDDIVGHAVNIRYRIDSYSGSCIAMIFVAKDGYQNLCYQFAGSCSVEVPMAGGSQAAIKAGMMQAEAYARAAMVSAGGHLLGGIGSALMGSLGGAISSVSGIASDYANAKAGVEAARVANKSSVQHSGQFGASHGAMGQKIPFIIIRNPIQVKVVNYNDDYGFPAHKRVIIGGCTGYLRVREVNVISAHATDDEKAAIEALLKNGVYVS